MEMEQNHQQYFHEDDLNDDALSFCDLPLNRQGSDEDDVVSSPSSPRSDDEDDEFEFAVAGAESCRIRDHAVLFCGKSIPCPNTTAQTTPFPSDKYSHWKSESFHYEQLRTTNAGEFRIHVSARSRSVRLPETVNCRYPYQSSGNRKHYKVLIGLAKFPPAMELDDIRRRQSRRMAVVSGGQNPPAISGGESGGSSGKGHWGNFVRALRFKSNVVSALARVSFGCVRRV